MSDDGHNSDFGGEPEEFYEEEADQTQEIDMEPQVLPVSNVLSSNSGKSYLT
jgi:hypothetical protein